MTVLKMSNILVLVLGIGLVRSSVGQIIQNGQCNDNINLQTDFDVQQFLGKWYEISKPYNPSQLGDCSYYEFGGTSADISTSYSAVNANFLENANGRASVTEGTARLTLTGLSSNPIDFWILLTDYVNFAVAFNCINLSATQRSINVWLLGRETAYPNEMIPALISTTLNNLLGINSNDLRQIDHSENACYVLPVIEAGQPVVLPGQCNPNIAVVQNFDVARFGGLWHENYAYISENSVNRCSRAEYTLQGGVVGVVNSQVVDQTLRTVSGTATASADGSGKVTVVLNLSSGDVTQDLWVLDTDYDSYAVLYSCVNLNNNQQRVYSWINSRTRQLTAEAQAAVDRVVASQVVLNYAYYIRTDQSDEACFFYPEPAPNKPVIFRGSCDQSIPAKADFNPVAYMGTWYDIESYPSPFQTGTCRTANYDLVGGVVDVYNTQVLDQTLDTIRGIAEIASDDGSAKLNVTFPILGTNATIRTNYWVLDTDYTSYALVYSCLDINEDERQVWSWKLSRTRQLTQQASLAINNVINNIPVLDQRYFEAVDHSNAGCFYYPEPQEGVPVVFPGQCDETISVVQNFNLQQFAGIWHEIETYPKEQVQGQCINHEYSAGTGNTLNLQTSQIVDQFRTLSTSTVRFSSTDNSAKLNIDITVNGQVITIPFWILSVDYNDYALAYSCVNLNENFRGVYSWKLSRTKQLSSNAATAISNVIANIQVLDQVYYEQVDQSDEACFYLPDLAPGEPIILVGQCDPNIRVVQNFDASRYLGRWRLLESYPSEFQSGQCNQAEYSPGAGGTVDVFNNQVIDQSLNTITGSAALASVDGSGKLLVTFPSSPTPSEYWILDTDYDSYALVYSCQNLNTNQRRVWSWKMSRTRTFSQDAVNAMNQVINSVNVLNNRYYENIDHSDQACFYFPEPSDQPVIFRGQCDQNINVVQNFNAAAYLGLWHNIELYPSNFQQGTCSNAFYSLGSEVVDVLNTQVDNQTLLIQEGIAVVASTDGSAKLDVTFNVSGIVVTTPYWVLATDYVSYSLVYTCVNIDEDHRQVWSWKLSRSKQLSAAAASAINAVTSGIQVLDDRYYKQVDQSRDGCFYFPEAQQGVPVVFPGQCDTNIPVVQNFNLNQFQGIWHEIQAYPKEQQQGQCINHQYSAGTGNTLNLQSSQVYGLTLGVNNGTLSFTSTDNSARMSITITVDGADITIPFWILSVDYSDYALAYSCVNLNEDFRGVYSWKLSRSKTLSTAANNAINNVIATVQVLDNVYYEDIDQSDNACFFLPDLSPGEPVIFPGQCDPNIPVVQGFQAANYLGRWRLIESYAAGNQRGTCNQAEYSAADDGSVIVFNNEVVDQTLSTITGSAVPASTDGSGKLLVTFPSSQTPIELWILRTDYTSYSLAYSCQNINADQRRVWSWKLSRTRTLTNEAVTAINEVVNNINVLDNRYYTTVDHSDQACFYFPEPSDQPVIFRGQCDQNINVVQNFNAAAYLGLWHNIELYPSNFQQGTCSNAFYSLGSEVVDVLNTQVDNQTLLIQEGIAVVASTDGSAKLDVTFNVSGIVVTTPYWVLATDYVSYSLVYTCVNIDEDHRQVWSWKLSRSKQLSAAAATAINAVTSGIQVLDDRYYKQVDQSRDGCFYFPEAQQGVPVVFPGQCDTNIPVVQGFNLNQFQGIWHEIQAYPKEQQQGQCINHRYSAGTGNTLNLQSSQVYGLTLGVNTGTLSFTSTDNSARMSITITVDGTVITIPFWILSVDYSDYALAYSCVNLNEDFRGVYSWKLSRTKTLSTAANNAINNVIATVQVLDNVYYEDIDQSDDACFYLPDLSPGEPAIFPGQCDPNIPVVQNFQVANYLGRWRLIESYATEDQLGTCNQAQYSAADDGSVIVFNTEVVNQTLSTITGSAVPATTDGSGKLLVTFPSVQASLELWILSTDYTSYSLAYSCQNINANQRRVWSWKLSRTRTLTNAAVTAINEVVNNINVLDNRYYSVVDHSDDACFYFPEPSDQPVIFRGQCDQNINVFQNFNAALYLGLWHNIELYPSNFQQGTCSNALYSLGSEGVDVLNTQVDNQTLLIQEGIAVVASTDGSAKLDVTFNVSGIIVTTPYWVLATDYVSYSLVYTCVNIDEEHRQVWSWKLSRSKQLSAAAATAINAVTSGIQVLDDRYYKQVDQSRDGCFYFPEAQQGVPVVFPGQCDTNIPVVQGFSLTQFQGIWHEIQAYPKEQQQGQCINHRYSAGTGNTLNLQSSQVYGLTLGVNTGTLSFTSTDNSARMSITITVDGAVITIPFWILSVDYSDYALAYSCVNLNEDFRGVYSWKLSRTKTLSTAANNAINNVIATVQVLDNVYYEDIDQSDDACFYLPDLSPGEPAIFPGQCDPNIPVVQNFQVANYLGRWRLIQSYATEDQLGTCNQAQYSAADDGSVIVFNTEVVNQTLSTITGSAVPATTDGSGKLLVTFPSVQASLELWILSTDYTSYSLAYSCQNINADQRRVWSWKLSRTTTLTNEAVAAINEVVNTVNVLDDRYYSVVDHSDEACFYYPQPNGPVRFRGQCNENIPVVTQFNAERYLGTWYDIESYPTAFQDGTCPTAYYSAGTDGVDVYNTQVINQQLDTINGLAVVTSTDGSAKLAVTFPIVGTNLTITTPYWILATDYDNFALVYSCSNIDDEYRSVTSWKLSRTQTLSEASSAQINTVIAGIDVLDQQYYIQQGHSTEDCFFYPDNSGGPVILDGQCESDATIDVVTGFDTSRFAGTWVEISRFPSELQSGECVASEYVFNQNGFDLTTTAVLNERLQTLSGRATFAADGRGILSVSLSNQQTTINGNLYILDTDYEEFALLYSCRNVDNLRKQVYSWKLRRTRGDFSQNANDRINSIVSNRIDLFEGYYETTKQDNDGCFYYPVFDTPQQAIVLPGPCDTSIRGVPNFNVDNFLGRWYEIERYPQPNQGTTRCNRVRYTGTNGATFDIVNAGVQDRTLRSITGSATVASVDGRGELSVELLVGGNIRTGSLYVLDTDYTNYALIYNCQDMPDNQRRVASWKFSRSRTLSDASNNAINNVISETQGLIQDYYNPTNQSDEACFYVPTFNANQAPQFRARCDSITGMQNFDVQRYIGWWHEIERYPSDSDLGTCRSSQYQASGNQVQFVDTSVFDLTGQIATGTVVASSNGRLVKTLSNGQQQELWVLDTDYENYSLVLTCETVDDEYVRVWSAKYSKSRELTQAAQDAMAPTIADNDFLYDEFYVPADQTGTACFYYPEEVGERVILPGQCDENIPVQANFDIGGYSGTWYQMERYPYPEVSASGTCVGAKYTVDSNTGVVHVTNWHVVDDELKTIEGEATVTSNAKLNVVLNIPDTESTTTTDLYILSTDYISYSLAYTCENVNQFQRTVVAFKLSRTRTLPSSAVTAINNYMAQRQELHQPFFIQIEQNEECEEPSSSYLVKSSIIVLFICFVIQILV